MVDLNNFIFDDNKLREMRKLPKGQRRNIIKHEGLEIHQYYDASTDVYHPFNISVYENGRNKLGISGKSSLDCINRLIHRSVSRIDELNSNVNNCVDKLRRINEVLNPYEDD